MKPENTAVESHDARVVAVSTIAPAAASSEGEYQAPEVEAIIGEGDLQREAFYAGAPLPSDLIEF